MDERGDDRVCSARKERTMKSKTLASFTMMTLFATLAIPVGLSGQKQNDEPKHHHYKLIDLGTFGGPNSGFTENFLDLDGGAAVQVLSNQGTVMAGADTSTPDPFGNFFDDGFEPNAL